MHRDVLARRQVDGALRMLEIGDRVAQGVDVQERGADDEHAAPLIVAESRPAHVFPPAAFRGIDVRRVEFVDRRAVQPDHCARLPVDVVLVRPPAEPLEAIEAPRHDELQSHAGDRGHALVDEGSVVDLDRAGARHGVAHDAVDAEGDSLGAAPCAHFHLERPV